MTTSEDCCMAVAVMDSFCVALEARSPARRCLRAYEIEVTEDLFGARLLRISYGRIGTPGRTKARCCANRFSEVAE